MASPGDALPWVFLDGDDTLWKTTVIYDRARMAVCDLIAARGHDSRVVSNWAQHHDVEQAKLVGYSMHRFPNTMRSTVDHFVGDDALAELALTIGYGVYFEKAELMEDAENLLRTLLAAGYRLALVTAGDRVVQQKRVDDFPFRHYFDQVFIVPRKNVGTYTDIIASVGADTARSWMVGDSLRSDVVPAAEVGLNSVLLETHNWAAYEKASHSMPEHAHSASSLADIMKIITSFPAPSLPSAERERVAIPGFHLP